MPADGSIWQLWVIEMGYKIWSVFYVASERINLLFIATVRRLIPDRLVFLIVLLALHDNPTLFVLISVDFLSCQLSLEEKKSSFCLFLVGLHANGWDCITIAATSRSQLLRSFLSYPMKPSLRPSLSWKMEKCIRKHVHSFCCITPTNFLYGSSFTRHAYCHFRCQTRCKHGQANPKIFLNARSFSLHLISIWSWRNSQFALLLIAVERYQKVPNFPVILFISDLIRSPILTT